MYNKLPELSLAERQMPLAKYYYRYPMHDLSDEVKAEIFAPPIDPADAVKPEHFIDWLKPKGEYEEGGKRILHVPRRLRLYLHLYENTRQRGGQKAVLVSELDELPRQEPAGGHRKPAL